MGRLDDKVAVITGAAGGIGREAALLFSAEGAAVVVADTGRSAGAQTAAECARATFVEVDVSDAASVAAMYATAVVTYGGIDILYNNAGIMPPDDDSILTTEPDAWDRVQAVNAKGVLPLLQVRDTAFARAWWRLGDQRGVVRCPGGGRDVADRLHGVEGGGAVDESGARGPVCSTGCSSERVVPRAGGDTAPHAPLCRQPRRV